MGTWDTGKATFTCENCGSTYECKTTGYPAPDPTQEYRCKVCGAIVHSWKGTRDYSEWRLVKRNS